MINKMHKLYTFYLSSASWRVRMALNLKKIPYEPVFVDLFANE
jgi:glutathione S-transferase